MTALTSASQNSTTPRRRSVHQRSLPYWLPHAWVRSTGRRRLAWTGAGLPRVAIVPGRDADHELDRRRCARGRPGHEARLRATLDCTGGWYAHQDWEGVPVAALGPNTGAAQSLHVHPTRRPC